MPGVSEGAWNQDNNLDYQNFLAALQAHAGTNPQETFLFRCFEGRTRPVSITAVRMLDEVKGNAYVDSNHHNFERGALLKAFAQNVAFTYIAKEYGTISDAVGSHLVVMPITLAVAIDMDAAEKAARVPRKRRLFGLIAA